MATQQEIATKLNSYQPLGETLNSGFTLLPTVTRIDDSIQEHAATTGINLLSNSSEVRRQFASLLVELILLAWLHRHSKLADDGAGFRESFAQHLTQLVAALVVTIESAPKPLKARRFLYLIVTEIGGFLPAGAAMNQHERIACVEAAFARGRPSE